MQVAYITRKVFADDSEEIRIKLNAEITPTKIAEIQNSKKINKIMRETEAEHIRNEISKIKLYDYPKYERKIRILRNQLELFNIDNLRRSARRARQNLYDICRCNDFQYFITWTFDNEKVERLNDKIVKRKFTQFQNNLHKQFPNMYYVAVPEYHKRGGLHFHLLVGGVTTEELNAVPAVNKRGKLIYKNGKQIFNVKRWKLGYSTLSIIGNTEAAKHYICKYITKQHYDTRFFGKRRYYVSNNISRPKIEKYQTTPEKCLDGIDFGLYIVAYADESKGYAVFETDGNGVFDPTRNAPEVLNRLELLRRLSDNAPPRGVDGGACPYSTLRTLDSNDGKIRDWKALAKRIDREFRKAIRTFKPPHEDYKPLLWEEQTILDEYYANIAKMSCQNDEELLREIGLID